MELLDVVDVNDNVIGTATRESCHINPSLIHRAVHFTLINKESKHILLTQRSYSKETDPGKICFLGEHIVSGENWGKAVQRAVSEELGFKAKKCLKAGSHIFRFPNQTEFVRFYLAEWNNKDLIYDKNEIINISWLDIDTLAKRSSEYSPTTQYWVKKLNWKTLIKDFS